MEFRRSHVLNSLSNRSRIIIIKYNKIIRPEFLSDQKHRLTGWFKNMILQVSSCLRHRPFFVIKVTPRGGLPTLLRLSKVMESRNKMVTNLLFGLRNDTTSLIPTTLTRAVVIQNRALPVVTINQNNTFTLSRGFFLMSTTICEKLSHDYLALS